MNRVCRAVVVALAVAVSGCAAFEREQLEQERTRLQAANDSTWQDLDRRAPVGSRWASHPDTTAILSGVKSNDARIREIDGQLAR